MSMQGSLSIERMCQLAQVSRAGFYRSLAEQTPVEEEMEVRAANERIGKRAPALPGDRAGRFLGPQHEIPIVQAAQT
jgi:hypothetical protein